MPDRSRPTDRGAIEVDLAMSELRDRFDSANDSLLHLLDLINFVDEHLLPLRPPEHAVSFIVEAVHIYDDLLSAPIDPSGIAPNVLGRASNTLSHLVRPDTGDIPQTKAVRSIERLTILSACQYTVVAGYDDALRVLDLSGADLSSEPGPSEDGPTWLRSLVRVRYPQHIKWADAVIDSISSWWGPAENRCCFPAVLRRSSYDGNGDGRGYIRRLTLDIRSYSSERDRFSIEFATDTDANDYLNPAITAGRTVLNAMTPDAARRSYSGGYRIARVGLAHAGASAGLAMASLFVCEAQRFDRQRVVCSMMPRTVMTGVINETGAIGAVAADTLAAKLEAVFFSPADTFVLPQSQLPDAVAALARLNSKYPRRKLILLGKSSLTDVFSDRRIVSIREKGRIPHAASVFWRQKWAVSAIATALLLLGGFVFWQVLTIDDRPVELDISDAGIRLLNQSGRVIWRKEASRMTSRYHAEIQGSGTLAQAHVLADVNADGYKDALWVELPDGQDRQSVIMHGLDGRTRKPLWDSFVLSMPLDYPHDISIHSNYMRLMDIVPADLTGDGLPELVLALAHVTYYPAAVSILNPRSGDFQKGYQHAGRLRDILVADLDDRFPPEILAIGTNNAFNTGVLIVLDADSLHGIGPASGSYLGGSPPTARERGYLRFPLTKLARYTGLSYGDVFQVDVLEESRFIRVATSDLRIMSEPATGPAGLRWDLDFSLRPISVGTDDYFDNAYERAYEEGLFDGPLDNAYKIGLMKRLEMWTKDGWKPVPLSDRANVPAELRLTESRDDAVR